MTCARETRDSCVAKKPDVFPHNFLFEVVCKIGCVVMSCGGKVDEGLLHPENVRKVLGKVWGAR